MTALPSSPFVTWRDLEGIRGSEISHTDKDKYFVISPMCGNYKTKKTKNK